jgi:hypothetical protein
LALASQLAIVADAASGFNFYGSSLVKMDPPGKLILPLRKYYLAASTTGSLILLLFPCKSFGLFPAASALPRIISTFAISHK